MSDIYAAVDPLVLTEAFSASEVCDVLSVSRSGFYTWRSLAQSRREARDRQWTPWIRSVFWRHRRRCGARRIAVDKVRRAENKALQAIDDDRLKRTRQLWHFSKPNLSAKQKRAFDAIKKRGLKTARAWALKEQFRWFWRYVYPTSTEDFFDSWYAWAIRCRLKPILRVAWMLRRHLPNLLSYFRRRITNAKNEGYNSVIQALRYAARGFRSFPNYRTRILFFCGKLDVKPQLASH